MARPVVLLGTGTSVGKTHLGERLLRAVAAEGHVALGYKPVESGFTADADSDIARLRRASTFHVKPDLVSLTFSAPVSPHLAARLEGRAIDLPLLRGEIQRACASNADVVLVELPGGAFSPMSEAVTCAAFARSLRGVTALLVAVDRLGVLHDVGAATRACAALGLPLLGIVLNAPEVGDDSTHHNAKEFPHVTAVPVIAALPRGSVEATPTPGGPLAPLAHRLLSLR